MSKLMQISLLVIFAFASTPVLPACRLGASSYNMFNYTECIKVTGDGPNSNYAVTNCGTVTASVVLGQPGEVSPLEYIQAGTELPMGTTNKPYRYWSCASPEIPYDTGTGQVPQYNSGSVKCR